MATSVGEHVERLRSVPLFARLDDDALARIAEALVPFEAPPGHLLANAAAEGAGMFFVIDGTVEVDAARQTIELGPGEFVGELALLNADKRRTARIRAKTDVRGYALSRPDFERLVEAEPKLALALLQALAERLSKMMR